MLSKLWIAALSFLVVLSACGQGETVSQQYQEIQQLDGLSETFLEDAMLVDFTFGYSESHLTIAEFLPEYVSRYMLTPDEVIVVGRWFATDYLGPGSYVFLPNRIALFGTSVGQWRIEDGTIFFTVHGYLSRDENWTRQDQIQNFTRIEPRDYVIGRVSYIHESGYTTRPFRRIDVREYRRGYEPRDVDSFEPTTFIRVQHSEDIINNFVTRYDHLNIVLAMEDRGITTEEFLASDDLIEALVGTVAWVIERRLQALGI